MLGVIQILTYVNSFFNRTAYKIAELFPSLPQPDGTMPPQKVLGHLRRTSEIVSDHFEKVCMFSISFPELLPSTFIQRTKR